MEWKINNHNCKLINNTIIIIRKEYFVTITLKKRESFGSVMEHIYGLTLLNDEMFTILGEKYEF